MTRPGFPAGLSIFINVSLNQKMPLPLWFCLTSFLQTFIVTITSLRSQKNSLPAIRFQMVSDVSALQVDRRYPGHYRFQPGAPKNVH